MIKNYEEYNEFRYFYRLHAPALITSVAEQNFTCVAFVARAY